MAHLRLRSEADERYVWSGVAAASGHGAIRRTGGLIAHIDGPGENRAVALLGGAFLERVISPEHCD
jgi:hypothetical protein